MSPSPLPSPEIGRNQHTLASLPSVLLKPLILEFQCPAVFRHCPHDVVRCAVGNFCFDFECHLYVCADEAREM